MYCFEPPAYELTKFVHNLTVLLFLLWWHEMLNATIFITCLCITLVLNTTKTKGKTLSGLHLVQILGTVWIFLFYYFYNWASWMLLYVHVDDKLSGEDTHQGASIEGSAWNLLPENPQEKPTGHETTAVLLLLFYPKCAELQSLCGSPTAPQQTWKSFRGSFPTSWTSSAAPCPP